MCKNLRVPRRLVFYADFPPRPSGAGVRGGSRLEDRGLRQPGDPRRGKATTLAERRGGRNLRQNWPPSFVDQSFALDLCRG